MYKPIKDAEYYSFRAKCAEEYAALPVGDREAYAASLGVPVKTIRNWVKNYTDKSFNREHNGYDAMTPEEKEQRREEKAASTGRRARWAITSMQAGSGMKTLNVGFSDLTGRNEGFTVVALSNFVNGKISDRMAESIASKAFDRIATWGFDVDASEIKERVQQLWK